MERTRPHPTQQQPPSPPPHARGSWPGLANHLHHEGPAWTGNQGLSSIPGLWGSPLSASHDLQNPPVVPLNVEPHPPDFHDRPDPHPHTPPQQSPHLPLQELSQLGSGCRGFADKLLSTCPHLPALSPLLPPELTLILFIFPLKSLLWSRNQLCGFQLPDFQGEIKQLSPSKGTVEG